MELSSSSYSFSRLLHSISQSSSSPCFVYASTPSKWQGMTAFECLRAYRIGYPASALPPSWLQLTMCALAHFVSHLPTAQFAFSLRFVSALLLLLIHEHALLFSSVRVPDLVFIFMLSLCSSCVSPWYSARQSVLRCTDSLCYKGAMLCACACYLCFRAYLGQNDIISYVAASCFVSLFCTRANSRTVKSLCQVNSDSAQLFVCVTVLCVFGSTIIMILNARIQCSADKSL